MERCSLLGAKEIDAQEHGDVLGADVHACLDELQRKTKGRVGYDRELVVVEDI